jgi:hypothetical protein
MKPSTALSFALSLLPLASAVPSPAAADLAESANLFDSFVQQATDTTLESLEDEGVLVEKRTTAACTAKNISIRRELYVNQPSIDRWELTYSF